MLGTASILMRGFERLKELTFFAGLRRWKAMIAWSDGNVTNLCKDETDLLGPNTVSRVLRGGNVMIRQCPNRFFSQARLRKAHCG